MKNRLSTYRWLQPNHIPVFIIWLFHISALIGSTVFGKLSWFITKTPFNLLLCFGLLVWIFPLRKKKTRLLFGALFACGMLAEITGVQTGLLFGTYSYGSNLGPKILGVPWTIGINWALLTFITGCLTAKWCSSRIMRITSGAALMLLLDLLLEGIAPAFDFWEFSGGTAPLYNYICWAALATLMQMGYHGLQTQGNYTFSLHLYLAQVSFFLVFNLWMFL